MKVVWRTPFAKEASWEPKAIMQGKYPHFLTFKVNLRMDFSFKGEEL